MKLFVYKYTIECGGQSKIFTSITRTALVEYGVDNSYKGDLTLQVSFKTYLYGTKISGNIVL